jgi:8-oxo-dGTP diphosphatase
VIEAAGGAVWRVSGRDRLKVVVIHRPRYDDWSLPKGKLHPGETHLDAALREIHEETGLRCEPGPSLPDVRYIDRKGRPKRVRYWAMQAVGGGFAPNPEVDEIRWVRVEEAADRLTYTHDLPVLTALTDLLPIG